MTIHHSFFDRQPVKGYEKTKDGFLIANVKVARTGIQIYSGREMGKPTMDTVRVWRPESEVFDEDSVVTYVNRPVTDDHPTEMVDAKNWKKHAVGSTGGKIMRDGEFIALPMMILDHSAAAKVDEGKRELSMGYDAEIEWTSGTTPDGKQYDAIQRKIRINHMALVDAGRAGSECRIRDDASVKQEDRHMADIKMRTVIVDGFSVETTDHGAQAIEKLMTQLQATKDGHAANIADLKKQIADKDAELGKKDGEIKKLQDAALSPEKLEAMIADRSALAAKVKTIVPNYDAKGKDLATVRREVVALKMGDEKVKDKSDDYIAALFDTLEGGTTGGYQTPHRDPVRDAVLGTQPLQTLDKKAEDAHAAMVKRMQDGYKPAQQ